VRRALLLCLLLVACRNDTDERLKKVEKELADIKANPPVEKIYVPTPTATAAAAPATDSRSPQPPRFNALRRDVAAIFVHQDAAAYVPFGDNPEGGLVYQVQPGQTVLFWFDPSANIYRPIQVVPDIVGPDFKVSISEAQMTNLQALLKR
jgi:hypothetical protein